MPELVNSNLVNVVENNIEAYLNWYDDKTTWLNTRANGVYFNPDMSYTFANAINMNLGMSDDWLGYFSFVNNMSHMAYDCRNLRGNPAVPPKVENMYRAFWNCVNLGKANVGPAVTNMTESFYHCNNIQAIDVGVADASNFANIVFKNENNYLDYTNLSKVSNIVVSGKVLNMYRSFYSYPTLYSPPNCGQNTTNFMEAYAFTGVIGEPVVGNNVIDASRAYYSCPNVTGNVYTGKNTQNIYQAFTNCINLWGNVNIGNLVTNASHAFENCKNLKGTITVGRSVNNLAYAFSNCSNLTNHITTTNVDSVDNMYYAFYECTGLKGTPLASQNVLDMRYAYYDCYNITGEAYIGSKVNNMDSAYGRCFNLERINVSPERAENIYDMRYAFYMDGNAKGVGSVGAKTTNAFDAYWGCKNLEEFYVADDPNTSINMGLAFYNCVNAKGVAVYREGNMYQAYYGCNNVTGINFDAINSCWASNTMFSNNTYTNLSNVNDIFLSDRIVNAQNIARQRTNMKGQINHSVDGWMGNNITDLQSAFYQDYNLTGDGYVPDSVKNQNWSFYKCKNLNGNGYISSNVTDLQYARQCFEECNNLASITVNCPNSDNMYGWVFSNCKTGSNNYAATHNVTNLSNLKYIEIGNGVKTMIDFIDPTMWSDANDLAAMRAFSGYVTAGANVTNMCRAFRGCYNLERNVDNKTANVGNKVVNLDATFQYCQYLENAQCPNSVQIATYSYYNCFNLYGNPALGTGLKNTHNMYYECRNLNGIIPDYFKYAKLVNSVNMFYNCVKLNSQGNFIVPMSDNIYNMYRLCDRTGIQNLDIYGCPSSGLQSGRTDITWQMFGSNQTPVLNAVNNIKNVRFLSEVTNNYGPEGSGAARTFCMDWYSGMENLYIDIPTAANFFPSTTGETVDNVRRDNQYRSNNFVNLKSVSFGPNVVNIYNFARRIYADPTNYLKNLSHISFGMANKIQSLWAGFCNIRALQGIDPIIITSPYVDNTARLFENCQNMKVNLSQCTFTESTKPAINQYLTFYNCYKITGEPMCYKNAVNTSQMYCRCYLLTGEPKCSNISTNTAWMYQECYNLTGNAPCSPVSTNCFAMYRNCFNLTDNAGTPKTGNMVEMYSQCYNMKGTINANFVNSTAHNMNKMFYNCSNLTGPAYFPKGGSAGNHWWSIYYNCRNLNGIEMYGLMGDTVHDSFATIFAQDGLENQPHIMNSDKLQYVNIYNTAGTFGDTVWGSFRYLNNVHDWYIDASNAAGLMYRQYISTNAPSDTNMMNRPSITQAKGVSAVRNIVIGPSVTSLAYFMTRADDINVSGNKYGTVNIDFSQAKNVTNMSNAFIWSGVNYGNLNLTHMKNMTNFMCAFERSYKVYECNIDGLDKITNMAYALAEITNLKGHGYTPYNCQNMYKAYWQTNIDYAVIRPIAYNMQYSFRQCNGLKEINVQKSSSSTNINNLCDLTMGIGNGNFVYTRGCTNLSNVTKLTIGSGIQNCANAFREMQFKVTPVIPDTATSAYCMYYNCPNINANLGNIYINQTGAFTMNCTFGGHKTPLVYGDIYLKTTVTSGCDYIRGILIRNDTTTRTSTTPALNWHWKRGSHWDTAMKANWLGQSIGVWNNDASAIIAMDQVIDNGWHNTAYNIYIFNNY